MKNIFILVFILLNVTKYYNIINGLERRDINPLHNLFFYSKKCNQTEKFNQMRRSIFICASNKTSIERKRPFAIATEVLLYRPNRKKLWHLTPTKWGTFYVVTVKYVSLKYRSLNFVGFISLAACKIEFVMDWVLL